MQSAINVTAVQLKSLEGPYLHWVRGSIDAFASQVGLPDRLETSQLAFVSEFQFLSKALEKASLLIVEEKILSQVPELKPNQALLSTPAIKAAMVLVLPLFDPRQQIQDPLISAQAIIHPTARIGARTRIAPNATVGAHAVIGDDCDLRSGVVIEAFCQVGNRCFIHANTTIGSDGFGFATGPQGAHHKVPQIGIVVIEDDVEIGANCAIDRATLGETRIGQGSKFDNLCHVAHNCKIGRHGLFAGGFFIAGSSTIGDHFVCGGNVVIADHVKICDKVMLGGLSAVAKDIEKPGAYAGYPIEPLRDNLRTTQNLTHLTQMRRQLRAISKKLGIDSDSQ